MAGGRVVIALLVCVVAMAAAWADPFSEVPPGHWAYAACSELAAAGLLSSDHASSFSGHPSLTRLELATAILEPLSDVDRALRALPPKADAKGMRGATAAALQINPAASDTAIARAAANLARLAVEFHDELRTLGLDSVLAVHGLELLQNAPLVQKWRAEALSYAGSARASGRRSPFGGDELKVPIGHGAVAFSYNEGPGAPTIMNYAAMSGARTITKASPVSAEAAWSEPVTSRLRTAYEYGLGRALTLRVGYENVARRGIGDYPLDAASFTTLGVGVQLTPSTSVKLSYSLFDYQSYVPDMPPLREHVAETAVSVEF